MATPRFSIVFRGLLVENILKMFKDNFKAMLDALYPTEALLPSTNSAFLPDLQQRIRGNYMRDEMPALAVDIDRGGSDESEDGSHGAKQIRINLWLTVSDSSPTLADLRLEKYAAALEATLDMPLSNYLLNVPANHVFGLYKDGLDFQYADVAKDANITDPSDPENKIVGWLKSVNYQLTLKYSER